MDTRITAKAAYGDHQLWQDVLKGKKFLTWRIGNQTHEITGFDITHDGKLAVILDSDEGYRTIRGNAKLVVHFRDHFDYQRLSWKVLRNLQQIDPKIKWEYLPETEQYRYFRVLGVKNGEPLTQGVNVFIALFDNHPIEQITADVSRLLGLNA